MKFLWHDFLKTFQRKGHKTRVGYVVPRIGRYHKITASTRIRAYDVIRAFRQHPQFSLELFRPFRNYDAVVFLKAYDHRAQNLAKKLQKKGTKVIFDININAFEEGSSKDTNALIQHAHTFATLSNAIITPSPYVQKWLEKNFPHKPIRFIPESIDISCFSANTKIAPATPDINQPLVFSWLGYAVKAEALYGIKTVLTELYEEYPFKLVVICEKNTSLNMGKIPVEFRRYKHKHLSHQLADSHVFLAPRDTTDPYNQGHSFTKIGVPMAVGVPVVASPIPAYLNSPAYICKTNYEWKTVLERFLKKKEDMKSLVQSGKIYCQENYSMQKVKTLYINLFENI